jgi:hypothetical protein
LPRISCMPVAIKRFINNMNRSVQNFLIKTDPCMLLLGNTITLNILRSEVS